MTNSEVKACQNCKASFEIDASDFEYYSKIGVPSPKMCPLCRAQKRLSFRNERVFYKRPCDKCKKDVVSMYSSNKPYPVWCYDCWFSDDWDATEYAREYDRSRPFFEQFEELMKVVPKVALIYINSVNSEYVNISADNKNCYMLIESSNNEGCIHCYWIQQCKDLVDVSYSHQTELSYESDDCYNCNKVFWSRGCHDSLDSYFLLNCRGSSNCIASTNLRNKRYYIFNKPHTKEEYEAFLKSARLDTYSGVLELQKKFEEFLKTQPRKFAEILNAPGSSGNYINDAKNCRHCFHSYDAEDCAYAEHVWRNAKDCMDVSTAGRGASLIYNSINCGLDVANYICCVLGWSSTFLDYSFNCFNSNYCFGGVGLRKKDYCILNKQYSKEEYVALRKEIVDSLKTRGEWGEFFPANLSPFGYNETVAQEQFPLKKEEASVQGFSWENHVRGTFGKETVSWDKMPDSIRDTSDNASSHIFSCRDCKKNYRIIPDELQFYKRLEIPLPRLCPDCRHYKRVEARGPNKLFSGTCSCNGVASKGGEYANTSKHFHEISSCPNQFLTSYQEGILYCEQCYNAEVV